MIPLVSIVVTVYNKEAFLDQCIQSLIDQSIKDIEIILVNDGSTDDSINICQKYSSIDNRIVLINKKNEGVVKARIDGVKVATGKYVSIIDGDDWIDSNYYEKFVCVAEDSNSDIVISGYTEERSDSSLPVEMAIKSGLYFGSNCETLYSTMIFTGKFFSSGINPGLFNKIFRNNEMLSEVEKVNPILSLGEDGLALFPMLAQAKKVAIDNSNKAYHYRISDGSLSHRFDSNAIGKACILINSLNERMNLVSSYNFSSQIDYYSAFILSMGILQVVNNHRMPCFISIARKLRNDIKELANSEIKKYSNLDLLPEELKILFAQLADSKYWFIVIREYRKRVLGLFKRIIRKN